MCIACCGQTVKVLVLPGMRARAKAAQVFIVAISPAQRSYSRRSHKFHMKNVILYNFELLSRYQETPVAMVRSGRPTRHQMPHESPLCPALIHESRPMVGHDLHITTKPDAERRVYIRRRCYTPTDICLTSHVPLQSAGCDGCDMFLLMRQESQLSAVSLIRCTMPNERRH
jgi:hypothetical protein